MRTVRSAVPSRPCSWSRSPNVRARWPNAAPKARKFERLRHRRRSGGPDFQSAPPRDGGPKVAAELERLRHRRRSVGPDVQSASPRDGGPKVAAEIEAPLILLDVADDVGR